MISPIAGLIFMDEDLDAEDPPEDQLPAEPTVLQKLSGDDLEDLLPVLLTL